MRAAANCREQANGNEEISLEQEGVSILKLNAAQQRTGGPTWKSVDDQKRF